MLELAAIETLRGTIGIDFRVYLVLAGSVIEPAIVGGNAALFAECSIDRVIFKVALTLMYFKKSTRWENQDGDAVDGDSQIHMVVTAEGVAFHHRIRCW